MSLKIKTIDEWPLQLCPLCGYAMTCRSTCTTWEGEYEIQSPSFECQNACQVEATVTYRQWIGRPGETELEDDE